MSRSASTPRPERRSGALSGGGTGTATVASPPLSRPTGCAPAAASVGAGLRAERTPALLRVSLHWRIGSLLLPGLLLLFGLFVVLGTLQANESAREMAAGRLSVARLTVSFLDEQFGEQFEYLETTAALIAGMGGSAAPSAGLSRRTPAELLPDRESYVTGLLLTDRAGRVAWIDVPDWEEPGTDLAARPFVRVPLDGAARYASPVHASGPAQQPAVVFAVPVRRPDGNLVGVLAMRVDPRAATLRLLENTAELLGESGHAELVDQDMRLIAAVEPGHPGRVLGRAEHPTFYRPLFERHASAVGLTDPIGDEDPDDRGQRHVMAFVPLESVPWGFGLGGTEASFTAMAERWRWRSLPLGALALAIGLGLVWVTRRGVVGPLQALTARSQRIAGGDLTTPVPALGNGEVRVLAETLDAMRAGLHRALEALAVEKLRYQAIVDSMADAVFTTDDAGRITAFNPAAELLTGWRAAEVIGRPCAAAVRLRSDNGREPFAEGRPPEPGIAKGALHCRDGRAGVVAVACSAIQGHDGVLKGTVCVLRDVSEEEELGRLKDEFLSMVSHELRTPLGAIKGYATTLLSDPDGFGLNAQSQGCLRVIVESSDELHGMVDNLLDMSTIEAGVFAVEPRPRRLRPLVQRTLERVRLRTQQHRLRVRVPASLPLVRADADRVEQVLHNLLDNAIKYAPGGGEIAVAAEAAGAEVIVSVADAGLGIPAEELEKVFERFQRGVGARARRIGGTGLGLAIARGIVEAHGGRIWAESPARPSAPRGAPGTVVRFTLPAVAAVVSRRRPAGRLATTE